MAYQLKADASAAMQKEATVPPPSVECGPGGEQQAERAASMQVDLSRREERWPKGAPLGGVAVKQR